MKKLLVLIAVFIFGSTAMFAQVANQQKASDKTPQNQHVKVAEQANTNPNAPTINFDKTTHDYGEIEQHGNGRCEFTFKNEGKEPLILSNVRSSCGCTVPEWPRKPIMPGQSEVIKVKYDTKRVGGINKTITVYSNASTPTVTLRIKGKVNAGGATKLPEKEIEGAPSPMIKK